MKISELKKEFVKGVGNDRYNVKVDKYFYHNSHLYAIVTLTNRYIYRSSRCEVFTIFKRKALDLTNVLPNEALNYCKKYGVSTWEHIN